MTGGLGSIQAEIMADTAVALASANVQLVSRKVIGRLCRVCVLNNEKCRKYMFYTPEVYRVTLYSHSYVIVLVDREDLYVTHPYIGAAFDVG